MVTRKEQKHVEIFRGVDGEGRWFGVLAEAGLEQSLVRITLGPSTLVGQTRVYRNADLTEVKDRVRRIRKGE